MISVKHEKNFKSKKQSHIRSSLVLSSHETNRIFEYYQKMLKEAYIFQLLLHYSYIHGKTALDKICGTCTQNYPLLHYSCKIRSHRKHHVLHNSPPLTKQPKISRDTNFNEIYIISYQICK